MFSCRNDRSVTNILPILTSGSLSSGYDGVTQLHETIGVSEGIGTFVLASIILKKNELRQMP